MRFTITTFTFVWLALTSFFAVEAQKPRANQGASKTRQNTQQRTTGASQQSAKPLGAVEKATAVLSKTISNELVQRFALCNIQSAIWGGYNVKVRVGASPTVDGKARIFRVTAGRFMEAVDPKGISGMAEVEGEGVVSPANQDLAFKKGMPFYITDVGFETPLLLHYTVISNPKLEVGWAAARIKKTGGGIRVEMVSIPNSFSSKETPQKLTFKLSSPVEETEKVYLSVVTQLDEQNYCLASNEVNLAPLAKAVRTK